ENTMIASSCPPQVTTTPTSAPSAPRAPRGRPSWSGLLRLSLVALPVKAYPAVASKTVSHFHLLHADCGQRLQYQKRCPKHGPIRSDEIVKGYPYARDLCGGRARGVGETPARQGQGPDSRAVRGRARDRSGPFCGTQPLLIARWHRGPAPVRRPGHGAAQDGHGSAGAGGVVEPAAACAGAAVRPAARRRRLALPGAGAPGVRLGRRPDR